MLFIITKPQQEFNSKDVDSCFIKTIPRLLLIQHWNTGKRERKRGKSLISSNETVSFSSGASVCKRVPLMLQWTQDSDGSNTAGKLGF